MTPKEIFDRLREIAPEQYWHPLSMPWDEASGTFKALPLGQEYIRLTKLLSPQDVIARLAEIDEEQDQLSQELLSQQFAMDDYNLYGNSEDHERASQEVSRIEEQKEQLDKEYTRLDKLL